MCSIQLLGIESPKYIEVREALVAFVETNHFDIEIQETNKWIQIIVFGLSSIPSVNYRNMTVGLGNEEPVFQALNEMFDAIKNDYKVLKYRCKNSGLCSNCQCY